MGGQKTVQDSDEEEAKLRASTVSRKEQRKKEAAHEKAKKKLKQNVEYADKKNPKNDPKFIQASAAMQFVRTKEREQKFNVAKEMINIVHQPGMAVDSPLRKRCFSAALQKMLGLMEDDTPPPKEVGVKPLPDFSPLSGVGPYQVRGVEAIIDHDSRKKPAAMRCLTATEGDNIVGKSNTDQNTSAEEKEESNPENNKPNRNHNRNNCLFTELEQEESDNDSSFDAQWNSKKRSSPDEESSVEQI
jgi:hypothetical protein